jgi:hypothetical protein
VACGSRGDDPLLTYFNPENGLTLRYPASWKTEQAEQDGVRYRYFLAPPTGSGKPAVSVTLVAGPLGVPLEEYAQTYLAGHTVQSSHDEERQGARGKSYLLASADGKTRQALLLVQESAASRTGLPPTPAPRPLATPAPGVVLLAASPSPSPAAAVPAPAAWVYGLYAQGDAAAFEAERPRVEEMLRSLALERVALYPEVRNEKFGFAIRIPPSWPATRTFSNTGTFLQQYASPAFGAEKRQTVHAFLTLTVEAIGGDATVDTYYKATMVKLGDAFAVLSHAAWRGGYVDVLRSETGVAESRGKRFYRAADGRGFTLAFDAREDIYPRVSRWCDMIASTLEVGSEVTAP